MRSRVITGSNASLFVRSFQMRTLAMVTLLALVVWFTNREYTDLETTLEAERAKWQVVALDFERRLKSQEGRTEELRAELGAMQHEMETLTLAASKIKNPAPRRRPIIVTGANTGYFGALRNLVASIHFWEPRRSIVVWDLGLTSTERREAESWDRVLVRDSPMKTALKTYRWKHMCIKLTVDEFHSALWIDAGSDVRGPLKPIDELMLKDGHFFVQGQDVDMSRWISDEALRYFGVSDRSVFRDKPSFSGNLQGWTRDGPSYELILVPLERCAQTQECMAPSDATLGNHRYDQTSLSVLLYMNEKKLPVTPHTEYLAAGRNQLSSSPWEPSSMLVYTARASSAEYLPKLSKRGVKFDPDSLDKGEEEVKLRW